MPLKKSTNQAGKSSRKSSRSKSRKATDKKPSKPNKSTQEEKTQQSDVVYPEIKVERCIGSRALTAATARKLLGWQNETENLKFDSFLLRDEYGAKIRCTNNVGNRPYHHANALTYKQDILRKNWQLNGHARIIGKYGSILSGQHVLTALVLASQEWEKNPGKWMEFWNTEPTIDTLLVKGIDETDDVKNTIDTARPSSLSDVLFRSEHFANFKESDRKVLARTCDYAVRLLWNRTGAGCNAFAPKRTHSESVDFIARHYRLLDCVKYIVTENGGSNSIGQHLSLGYSSALLYLQSCSTTEPDAYYGPEKREEANLDFALLDKACDFWTELAGASNNLQSVTRAVSNLIEEGMGSYQERLAIIIKAWTNYVQDKSVTATTVRLSYLEEEGHKVLDEPDLTVGGIDLGFPKEEEDVDEAVNPVSEKTKPKSKKSPKLVARQQNKGEWSSGDMAWVEDPDGDHFFGKVQEVYEREQDQALCCEIQETHPGKSEWDIPVTDLRLAKPKSVAKATS